MGQGEGRLPLTISPFRAAPSAVTLLIVGLFASSCATAPAGQRAAAAPEPEPAPEVLMASAREALARNDQDPKAWFQLGVAWQRQSEPDSAEAAFQKALEADPDNVPATVHLGLTLEDLHRYDDALAEYDHAIELAPNDPLPWVDKGSLLYFQFKRTNEAKNALVKALELDPDNADAHFNLGVMFADANLFGEARTEWQKVLDTDPDGPAGKLAQENLDRIQPMLEAASTPPTNGEGTQDASGE